MVPGDPIVEEMRALGRRWGHFLALGIILIIVGSLAIACSFIATLAITLSFGVLLAVGGLVQVATAFWAGAWRGVFLQLVLGILYLVAGAVMIKDPVAAAAVITAVLAISYMVGGLMRIVFALTHRTVGTGWVLLNGIVTLVLGLAVWWQWPWDSFWVIGVFVGIDLIFLGWTWVMLGAAVRPRRTQAV
jgi:uncharacterized membrane protein HdeD (DUF308 family)